MAGYAIGAGISALGNYFGNQSANNNYQKSWKQAQNYLQPYNQNGQDQYGKLNQASNNLMNPEQLENQWSSNYTESPYAQQSAQQAGQSGLNSASQQGLLGSSAALNNVQTSSSNIMQGDRQSYLNDLMDKYKTGISTSQGIYNTGAQAGNELAGYAMNNGNNQAQTGYNQWAGTGSAINQGIGSYMGNRYGGAPAYTQQPGWNSYNSGGGY